LRHAGSCERCPLEAVMKTLPHCAVFGLVAVPPMRAAEDREHAPAGEAAPGGAPTLAAKMASVLATAALVGLVLAGVAILALFASETRAIGQGAAGHNVPQMAPNAAGRPRSPVPAGRP
jgi:hypothetical protein